MFQLSPQHLTAIRSSVPLELPSADQFGLPEKVLQFGTGVLLRGLPAYFIQKANQRGLFNGRIVVVKSTDRGDSTAFEEQGNLYTTVVRGVDQGVEYEENRVVSAISRVLSAKTQWEAVLECARNPELQLIISNTTEVGIQLVQDDIGQNPPVSFPGKVLAFLYARYQAFGGSAESGMIIVPTELIPDNGKKLEAIVCELAHRNGLEEEFMDWLEEHNQFCNSLVDRIVPGQPEAEIKVGLEDQLGYRDDLMILTEPYRLWAIEGNEKVKSRLSFEQADEGVIIQPSIDLYRELKLRLLNGTHTLSCGLAFLAGFSTVKDAMAEPSMGAFIAHLMQGELAPAIPFEVSDLAAQRFARRTLDRFRNPHLRHQWISITAQYTSKMKMRNVPTLLQYYNQFGAMPEYMALGFAAYLLFMKAESRENGSIYGKLGEQVYLINDEKALYFQEKWQNFSPKALVQAVLADRVLWGADLDALPGWTGAVQNCLLSMLNQGVPATLQSFILNHTPEPEPVRILNAK